MENQMVFQRYELKYLITRQQRDALEETLLCHMDVDIHGHSSVRNIYYDTPDCRLIRQSLDRPLYKEKLRIRSYGRAGDQDIVFLELKKKYDSVVYKRRIQLPLQSAMDGMIRLAPLPRSQIGREIEAARDRCPGLAPMVFLSYERDAFFAPDGSGLRVTFDENIRYRTQELTLDSECSGLPLLPADTVLMELKVSASIPLWLARELSRLGIRKTTFSKYGVAYQKMRLSSQKGALQYV